MSGWTLPKSRWRARVGAWVLFAGVLWGGPAEARAADELVIVDGGKTSAVVVVDPKAGTWERKAAEDLLLYIERMSGAKPSLVDSDAAIGPALAGAGPVFVVGQRAIAIEPSLAGKLAKVAKPAPVLRADAIALVRKGGRVLVAGTNDDSHYYAVAELLRRWGCRWYLPTEFGECVPESPRLALGELDLAYAPPFEVRRYWLSWIGDVAGKAEFMHRNFFNDESVPSGHALAQYTKELIPPGKTMFQVPIADPATAEHVAKQLEPAFAKNERIMLGLEDGIYDSDSPADRKLRAGLRDKYFLSTNLTDPFLEFYNGVARRLASKHPQSTAKIGFLAYANITIPPQRDVKAEKPLVAYLAPIDIDPIHGMDDPRSPPRQEYREMLYRWAEVMEGRLAIYDYDQGMLVWRDIPNPSHMGLKQDVQHYRKAGILGVDTESRGAMATTFLNLFFRGQLYWNPDADVDALLADFYPRFYGPAAEPMRAYWSAIYKAWEETIVTEHEFFVAPAIYSQELVEKLRGQLAEAELKIAPIALKGTRSPNEERLIQRVQFTRHSFDVLDSYMAMTRAAATDADYRAAVAAGERGLAAREKLTAMNGTFTTYKAIGEAGTAWWPGEVEQYRALAALTDGTRGTLVAKLPLEWAFRRDPHDTGLVSLWAKRPPDLSWWESQADRGTVESRMRNPGRWEMLRTDRYYQSQGVLHPDWNYYNGLAWYTTEIELSADQAGGAVHLMFPGLFNECWLYVNGSMVDHREQNPIWWYNDYKFEWDVDLTGQLKPGKNRVSVRCLNPHHQGGMFRRPILYRKNG